MTRAFLNQVIKRKWRELGWKGWAMDLGHYRKVLVRPIMSRVLLILKTGFSLLPREWGTCKPEIGCTIVRMQSAVEILGLAHLSIQPLIEPVNGMHRLSG